MTSDLSRSIVTCCRRMADLGLSAGRDGNVTIRTGENTALVTPAGLLKADLTPDDIVEVDLSGKKIRGSREPSTELGMHLVIFNGRPDVVAVVHAHPPVATGFSVAGEGLDAGVLPELICQVGHVPLVPYGAPGTPELSDRIRPFLPDHDALLLANHGAVTMGTSLDEAQIKMESLEHAAKIILTARMLGRVNPLAPREVERLGKMRRQKAGTGSYPGCPAPNEEQE